MSTNPGEPKVASVATHAPLAPIVAPCRSPVEVLRKRLALGTGFLIGVASVAALVHATVLLHPPVPPPAPAATAPTPPITIPAPLVITIDRTIEAPSPPPPGAELGCPVITRADLPIGSPIDPQTIPLEGEHPGAVVAAAQAPQLAVLHGTSVWISDDDGRSFARAFEQHEVTQIAIDRDGIVYALAGDQLGVRPPVGKTHWRTLAACGEEARCERAIGVVGTKLVTFADEQISTTEDQGRTWKRFADPAVAWADHGGSLFAWKGALFQVTHYRDMCGVDDLSTYRLAPNGTVAHDTFHNYYNPDEAVLRASSDVDPTWTWTERCWTDTPERLGRCATRSATRSALLAAATLLPVEGARTLAVYGGSMVELCPAGARQIYRAYPVDEVDAVDAVGRALVMKEATLVRWSPLHGWRKLHVHGGGADPTWRRLSERTAPEL
ncbi:MAG: hypothetical protein IPQ07_29550 [Myxococcales bacterium]|nr:hypothetical protein [Myxococcales bacterium]